MSNRNNSKPVAVTGIGMICPLGITAPESWEQMLLGKSAIRRITKFDPRDCPTKIGGQLPDEYFELEKKKTSRRLFKQTVRATRMIRLCAQEAVEDSGAELDGLDPHKCAVIVGTSGSSVRSPEDLEGLGAKKFRIIREMVNASPAWISLDYGFKGPTYTVSAACASGSYAIASAYDLIRWGVADFAIAGGVDYLLTKNNVLRANFMKVLTEEEGAPEKAVRPFDKSRSGFVISDGACAVVLESYEHAIRSNARVYAWILGYASWSESYSLFSPAPYGEGMARTMEMAVADSKVEKKAIGYINANGTSTLINDYCETLAIKKVFDRHAYELLISSPKSMIGHTMGSSSAIEFAVTALALYTQRIPPTINYVFPDPDCDLNYVPNSMVTAADLKFAISNSFGLGGHNSVVVLSKFP